MTVPPGESVVIDFFQYFQFAWLRRWSFCLLNPVCDSNLYNDIQLIHVGSGRQSTTYPIRRALSDNEQRWYKQFL